jgi:diguanylate cyclase (GGDEF)-like protein
MSSFSLARRLRSMTPTLALAFVSADGSVASRVAAAHAGATVFLSKPLGAFELTSAVRNLLAARSGKRSRVLVLDDDKAFSALVGAILEPDDVDTASEEHPSKILEALDRAPPDLLLVDVHMPHVNGIDVCRTIRVTQRWQALPLIVVTNDSSLETRMAAFDAGADDYLLKPVVPQELSSRVRIRIDRARLLYEMTNVDPLTRLLSRRGFLDALAPRMSDALRHKHALALALLDVDHFKKVNDRYGHAAGDRVLAGLGELMASRFRLEDLRCRWGGEEFVLAFPGEDAATIVAVLERLLAELRGQEFAGEGGELFRVTFSAGVASVPRDGESTEALLKLADERLYAAKGAGRARVFGPQ